MEVNIQLDAGSVTQGADGALQTLERIKRLIETTEPITSKLGKDSRLDFSQQLSELKRLTSQAEATAQSLRTALGTKSQETARILRTALVGNLEEVARAITKVSNTPLEGKGSRLMRVEIDKLKETLVGLGAVAQSTQPAAAKAVEAVTGALNLETEAATRSAAALRSRAAALRVTAAQSDEDFRGRQVSALTGGGYMARTIQEERQMADALRQSEDALIAARTAGLAYVQLGSSEASKLRAAHERELAAALKETARSAELAAKSESDRVAALTAASKASAADLLKKRIAELREEAAAAELAAKAERDRVAAIVSASAATQRLLADRLSAERAATEAFRTRQVSAALSGSYVHRTPASEAASTAARRASEDAVVEAALAGRSFSVLGSSAAAKAQTDLANATRQVGISMREGATHAEALTSAMGVNRRMANDLHSAYRGLASGFGAMWLTWGNVLPLLAGAAISHAATNAVKVGADVGHTLAMISSLGEVAAKDIEALNAEILKVGSSSTYGPKEAAEALKTLALAGLSAKEQLAALPEVLDFAKVGEVPLQDAAETLVAVGTAYGYSADQYRLVGDIIAKTAAASMTSVQSMSESFKQSTIVGQLYGVSLKDTATALALLAQAGIKGQAAGTALRQMFNDLTGHTKKAAEALKKMGVNIFDDFSGKLKPLATIVGDISKSLEGLPFSEVMHQLQAIANERGLKGLGTALQGMAQTARNSGKEFTSEFQRIASEVTNSAGFMKRAALEIDTSTESAFKRVSATLGTTLTKAFQEAEPAVQAMARALQSTLDNPAVVSAIAAVVQGLSNLVSAAMAVVQYLAPLAGGFSTAALATVALTSGVKAATLASEAMGQAMVVATAATKGAEVAGVAATGALRGLWALMGPLALAAGIAATALLFLSSAQNRAKNNADSLGENLADSGKKLREQAERDRQTTLSILNGIDPQTAEKKSGLDKQIADYLKARELERAGLEKTLADAQVLDSNARERTGLKVSMYTGDITKATAALSAFDAATSKLVGGVKDDLEEATFNAQDLTRVMESYYEAQNRRNAPTRTSPEEPGKPKADHAGDALAKKLEQGQAYLDQLRDEITILKTLPDEYDKLTASGKELYIARLQLGSATDAAGKAYSAHAKQMQAVRVAQLEEIVGQEKVKQGLVDEKAARDAAAKAGEGYKAKLGQEVDELQAQVAVFGKSKEAVELNTLAKMQEAVATNGLMTVGKTKTKIDEEDIRLQAEKIALMQEMNHLRDMAKLADELRTAQEQLALSQEELRTLGMTGLERTKAIALRKVELEYAKKIAEIDKRVDTGALDPNQAQLEKWEAGQLARVQGEAAVNKAITDDYIKTAESINQSLTDALLRGFEGGKDFAKNFRDTLLNMFKTLVLRPIISFIVQPFAGSVSGMLSGFMGGGGAGGGTDWLGMGRTAKSAWDWTSSLFSGGGYAGYGGAVGSFAASTPGALAMAPGAATYGAGSAAAGFGSFNGGVAAGTFSGGTVASVNGAAAGAGAGSGLAGALPYIGIGALILSTFWDDLFGKTLKDVGVQGTFGGSDVFKGNSYQFYEGGIFSSDETEEQVLPAKISAAMKKSWKDVTKQVHEYAEILGLDAEKIKDFTYDFKLSLDKMDLKGDDLKKAFTEKLQEALKTGSNALAEELIGSWEETTETVRRAAFAGSSLGGEDYEGPGSVRTYEEEVTTRVYKPSEYAREGEDAIETLTRLATSLKGVNGIFDTLGLTLYETSLRGGDMASQLADAAGDLDKLNKGSAAYFQNFYTGSEQFATATRQVKDEMDRLGIDTMPATRQQFRSLVESLDLTTEEGRKTFAGLMAVSEAFAQIRPQLFAAAQEITDTIKEGLLGTFEGANIGTYMAQTVQVGIYDAVAGHFSAQITDIMLQGVIDPMIQAAITGSSVSAVVSQASIDAMIAQATAVAEAAAAIMNDPAFKDAIDRLGKAIRGIDIPLVKSVPRIDKLSKAVKDSGDSALKAAEDAARAAETIRRAWQSIGDSLMDEVNRIRGVMNESAGQGVDYWQAQLAIATAQARAGDQDAAKSLSGISQNLLRAGEESAGSLLDLQRLRAQVAQSLQDTAGYAYGQANPAPVQPPAGSGIASLLAGWGINFPGLPSSAPTPAPAPLAWVAPPTYSSAPSGGGNADVVAELQALRQSVQALEAKANAGNDLQRRGVIVLERWEAIGPRPARVET